MDLFYEEELLIIAAESLRMWYLYDACKDVLKRRSDSKHHLCLTSHAPESRSKLQSNYAAINFADFLLEVGIMSLEQLPSNNCNINEN